MNIEILKSNALDIFENTACKQNYDMKGGVDAVVDFLNNTTEELLKDVIGFIDQQKIDIQSIETELIPSIIKDAREHPEWDGVFEFAEWTTIDNTVRMGEELKQKIEELIKTKL